MKHERIAITGGSGFIGTNLVHYYLKKGCEVLNLDPHQPRDKQLLAQWKNVDIRDKNAFQNVLADFKPSALFHLGARTDLEETKDINGYDANVQGVKNVVEVVNKIPTLERVIYTSSRLVFRIDHQPQSDFDYSATTIYGKSKIEGEKIVLAQKGNVVPWTIVRPTSIWGPWFDIPYRSFFTLIQQGKYFHPRGLKVQKSFGFVGNIVFELDRLSTAAPEDVNEKVFFLADYDPIDVFSWAKQISQELNAPRIKEIPYPLLKLIAKSGDALGKCGVKRVPLNSFRLNNLVTNMTYDMENLKKVVGPLPYDQKTGVALTCEWLKQNPS